MNTKNQVWGYFGLQGIGNQNQPIPDPLAAHNIQNTGADDQQEHDLYNRSYSDMLSKAIEGLITKTHLNIFSTSQGFRMGRWFFYIRMDAPTGIYLLLKGINTTNRIGAFNLKDDIGKGKFYKILNNIKDILDKIS